MLPAAGFMRSMCCGKSSPESLQRLWFCLLRDIRLGLSSILSLVREVHHILSSIPICSLQHRFPVHSLTVLFHSHLAAFPSQLRPTLCITYIRLSTR